MTAITTGITSVVDIASSLLTAITTDAILVVVLSAGFVSLGLKVIRKLFKTSKSMG